MNQRADSETPSSALGIVECVPLTIPGRDVEVVAGRPSAFGRLADEGGDEPVERGRLLDRELEEMRLVGGRHRVREARVDLPLRGVVLVVDANEGQPEPADVVLHLANDASGIGPRVHPVDEPGRRLVRLELALRRPAQEEELELVADGDLQALRLGGGDRPAEDVARDPSRAAHRRGGSRRGRSPSRVPTGRCGGSRGRGRPACRGS